MKWKTTLACSHVFINDQFPITLFKSPSIFFNKFNFSFHCQKHTWPSKIRKREECFYGVEPHDPKEGWDDESLLKPIIRNDPKFRHLFPINLKDEGLDGATRKSESRISSTVLDIRAEIQINFRVTSRYFTINDWLIGENRQLVADEPVEFEK